jgi:hypothetical protein
MTTKNITTSITYKYQKFEKLMAALQFHTNMGNYMAAIETCYLIDDIIHEIMEIKYSKNLLCV